MSVLERVSAALRVLSHPHRLKIVELLLTGEMPVGELADRLGLAPNAVKKNVELQLIAEQQASVKGDAALLGILIRNLVDNAVRYSPADSTVQVRIDSPAGAATLTVCDQGPGIPEAEKARIWDRFYRVLGTGETGSGLGLSIVKQVADLHHAEIETTDGDNGKGLCIVVKFGSRNR